MQNSLFGRKKNKKKDLNSCPRMIKKKKEFTPWQHIMKFDLKKKQRIHPTGPLKDGLMPSPSTLLTCLPSIGTTKDRWKPSWLFWFCFDVFSLFWDHQKLVIGTRKQGTTYKENVLKSACPSYSWLVCLLVVFASNV